MQRPSAIDIVFTAAQAAQLYPCYKMERRRQLNNLVCRRWMNKRSAETAPQWQIREHAAQVRHAQRELADLRRNWSSVVAAGAPRMVSVTVSA